MKLLYASIVVLLPALVKAQVIKQPLAIKYVALGAYSKNYSDLFSVTSNEATLADLKAAGFGIYGERRFMLQELNGFTGVLALPLKSSGVGLQADYFGSAAYNESQLSLLYGRKLTDKISVGVKFNYYAVRMAGYGTVSAVNFQAGIIYHITEQLHTGIDVYNPTGSKLGKLGNERLPSIYKLGLGYEVSSNVFVSAEMVKQEDREGEITVVCTPSGGAQTVRLKLKENWEEMPDEELLEAIVSAGG